VTYGDRLRELRAERQLSLRQVEERGGPNKDTMSLLERGVHKPHAQTLGRIAKAFDMSVAELRAELEAAESPLGQAPPSQLPLNGFPEEEERREFTGTAPFIRYIDGLCDRWERAAEEGEFNRDRFDEFVANYRGIIAEGSTALRGLEAAGLDPAADPAGRRLGAAMARLAETMEKVAEAAIGKFITADELQQQLQRRKQQKAPQERPFEGQAEGQAG
jgi:transcriptional regulator with XRE-family HTH domain